MTQYRTPNLDAFAWQSPVKDKDLAAPPGSPAKGDRYIVGPSATGAWVTHDGQITYYNGSTWIFLTAFEGLACWVEDENKIYVYNGTVWQAIPFTATLPTPVNIALLAYSTIWTNMPAAETEFIYELRTKADLTSAIQCRMVVRVYVAGYAGSQLRLQYSTNEAAWSELIGYIDIDTTGTKVTGWVDVPVGAKGDVYIRIQGRYGDDLVDPRFSHIDLQVK